MSLKEKVVIVSGGARGIGRSIVLAFAQKGAKVAFTYHSSVDKVNEIYQMAEEFNGIIMGYKVDIRNNTEVKELVSRVINNWGSIDIVINNAGIRKDKTLAFMSLNDWTDVMDTNISGTFNLTQASIFYMLKKRRGRIINISSISGLMGIAGQTNYASSKSALFGFTRSLAKEVAPYGITVNTIAPGAVETDMVKSLKDKDRDKLMKDIPMGRMCTPEEVAKLVILLSDDEICPNYLTGTVIPLDGGMGS